jgi:hypothetical protein
LVFLQRGIILRALVKSSASYFDDWQLQTNLEDNNMDLLKLCNDQLEQLNSSSKPELTNLLQLGKTMLTSPPLES